MELKYDVPIKEYYSQERDEVEYDYKEIFYNPEEDNIKQFVLVKIFNEYFSDGLYDMYDTKEIIGFINDLLTSIDLWQKVFDFYYDEIKEYFRDAAFKYGYEKK